MSVITKPLLAFTVKNFSKISYDIATSFKIDGIRSLFIGNSLVSRTFKKIPNNFIRTTLEDLLDGYSGLDGEILAGESFNISQGNIMRVDGEPEFTYNVFDYVDSDLSTPFIERYNMLKSLPIFDNKYIKLVEHTIVHNEEELLIQEQMALDNGFEGLMLRGLDGKYKCGRSTENDKILGKLKHFTDAEAIVIGYTEKEHNGNEATKDVFGRTHRTSHQENKTGLNTLGALIVEYEGNTFNIGTGYDDATRQAIWDEGEANIGRMVKFTYQSAGRKIAPRFPVWVGFRDEDDIS